MFNALTALAIIDPSNAAYWARKQLNHEFGETSPYFEDDLSQQPEADWEWPGNAKLSVLRHPIYAEHDAETVIVYQAFTNEIGQAAAELGTLDVRGFSKSRMTWIKPSFNWMMYQSGWGLKEEGQATVLKIRLLRPEFFHLIQNSTLSHQRDGDIDQWKQELEKYPNRVQWDPDRDVAGNPVERRALQIGIAPSFMDFYLHQAIQNIEDITDFCRSVHKRWSDIDRGPQEPIFWARP